MASKIENLNTAISAIDAKIAKLQHRRAEIGTQLIAEYKKAHPEYEGPNPNTSSNESMDRRFDDRFMQQVNDGPLRRMRTP